MDGKCTENIKVIKFINLYQPELFYFNKTIYVLLKVKWEIFKIRFEKINCTNKIIEKLDQINSNLALIRIYIIVDVGV